MPTSLTLNLKNHLRLEDLLAYATGQVETIELSSDPGFEAWITKNHSFLQARVDAGWPVYGASTGFGSSSASRLALSETADLQKNLFRYHGCGVGPSFHEAELAAILLVRTNCLTQGCSGISFELMQRLTLFLQHRIFPLIPVRGSVGASGDLTPLSYIAAALSGERDVLWQGQVLKAQTVWDRLGLPPYAFKSREALSIMNGTSVMAAIAGLSWLRLERLYEQTALATAAMVELWQGPCAPFFPELHAVKPHQGQSEAAAKIFSFLFEPRERLQKRNPLTQLSSVEGAVQDPYSIRCGPQILGAFKDALNVSRVWIETEINSVNDNPVFLHEDDLVLNGGHFLGQHITLACDMLKASCANVVNLLDRQMALLMESRGRLPENLVSREVPSNLHHGFKAMQITMSAIASEMAKMAMPMSVFSRPTEASNQDVVSMGTTAARDLLQMSDLAMDAMSIHLMAIQQSFRLLEEQGQMPCLTPRLAHEFVGIGKHFPMLRKDRAMDREIVALRSHVFEGLA
ncbi:MAG: aromatic amino acid lyase [Chitinophagaceae bacterium]|nr:aromatic amino acid lyase [Oligoflexus sp.]